MSAYKIYYSLIFILSQQFIFGQANYLSGYDFRLENFVAQKYFFRVENFMAWTMIVYSKIFGSELILVINNFRVESWYRTWYTIFGSTLIFGSEEKNKLTPALAGGLYENHRPQNRFCGKLYRWIDCRFLLFLPIIE